MSPRKVVAISMFAFGVLVFVMANCSNEECEPCSPKDNTAPAAVSGLAARNPTSGSMELVWLSPGDDADEGTAYRYDIRYDTDSITVASWDSAEQVTNEPAPNAASHLEVFPVEGLAENTRYFFALKTEDESHNWSGLSNVPSATTLPATGLLEVVTARCVVFSLLMWIDGHYVGSFGNDLPNDQPITIEVPLGGHTLYAKANIVVSDTSYCWTKGFVISERQESAVLVLDCIGAACPSSAR